LFFGLFLTNRGGRGTSRDTAPSQKVRPTVNG
jgi:hypothetical protein